MRKAAGWSGELPGRGHRPIALLRQAMRPAAAPPSAEVVARAATTPSAVTWRTLFDVVPDEVARVMARRHEDQALDLVAAIFVRAGAQLPATESLRRLTPGQLS